MAAALVAPAAAHGGWKIDRVTELAERVWGGELAAVCPAGFRVDFGRPPAPLDPDSLGWSTELVCAVNLNRADRLTREWPAFCTIVLHELGHVLAYGHEHRGHGGIMRPRRLDRDVGYALTASGRRGRRVEIWHGADRRCLALQRDHRH